MAGEATQVNPKQPRQVLLIEDDPIDTRLVKKAFEAIDTPTAVMAIDDGDTALAQLRESLVRPDLVLLDLNLPGRDGRDVLEVIKHDPVLRRIPVVVLTTSSDEADVVSAYEIGANAFVSKPNGLEGWRRVVASLENFWFKTANLPPK